MMGVIPAHIAGVDVGAGVQKHLHGLRTAGGDGHKQGRETADRDVAVLNRAEHRRSLSVDIGAVRQQQLD